MLVFAGMFFRKAILCALLWLAAGSLYAGKKLHALFLGNSYTYYNNMPQMTASIAAGMGDTLIVDMYAPGGYTIDNHGADTNSRNKIKQGGWDYLILQEQSQLPALPGYFSNELYGICSLFAKYNPCGRVMFYMTWGRKNGDALNCPTFPPVCTYIGMDTLLRQTYEQMATSYYGELSPVGAVWRYVRNHFPGINLYDTDDSHPLLAGSYLAACTFYSAMFKKNPLAISYNPGLSATDASNIRLAAKTVVFDSLAYWNYTVQTPTADFSFLIGTGLNEVDCWNKSSFADSYLWDFGDGNTSALQHPTHNYANDGTYTIKLTAYNCDLNTTYQSSYQKTVSFCPFTPTITTNIPILCPGSTDTLWTQPYSSYQWFYEDDNIVTGATNQSLVNSIPSGYYVRATLNGCTEQSRVLKIGMASNLIKWSIDPVGNMVGIDSACIGDTIKLVLTFDKPVNDSLINWSFNGNAINGYHNDTLLITQSGTYEATARHEMCASLSKTQQLSFSFISCPTHVASIYFSCTIAPNPVENLLFISSPYFANSTCRIVIRNSTGQIMWNKETQPGQFQAINMSGYRSGLYIIDIQKDGLITHYKVLKL